MAMAARGTRRSTLIKRNISAQSGISTLLRRIGFTVLFFAVLAWGGLWFSVSGANRYVGNYMTDKFMKVTSQMGYRVENIMVEGRNFTDSDRVLQIVRLEKGDAVLRFNPKLTKQELETIPWVKEARVERRLPDTIFIKLQERVPFALWQRNKDLVLIDEAGVVLTDKNLKRFENLMMIRGEGAPAQAKDLVLMLNGEPDLKARVDHAVRIENRRWDIVLKDGKVLKMPEKDIGLAMSNLIAQHKKEGILDKPLTTIDVRDPARLIVRTEPGKVQDYNASLLPGENL